MANNREGRMDDVTAWYHEAYREQASAIEFVEQFVRRGEAIRGYNSGELLATLLRAQHALDMAALDHKRKRAQGTKVEPLPFKKSGRAG
jgi:hypothetical protein